MAALESALRRVGIEPAERALCGWAGLCLALLGATAYALLNSSETLFLKRVGVPHLPWALLASSALLVATTGLASRVLAEADRPRWLPRILLALAVLLLPFWWLLRSWDHPALFGAFILAARQILSLGLLVVWLALGDLVTGRQAKRLFAPLAAGITLGGVVGSFASDPVARLVGVEGLVLVGVLLILGAAAAAQRLRSAAPRRLETGQGGQQGRPGGRAPGAPRPSSLLMWRESVLFRLLLASLFIGGMLSPVLYFEFSYVADLATQGPDGEQRLLALYAQFRGWLNVVMLVTQLWLSTFLYRRIGLPLALALWPGSYLLGFAWMGASPTLTAGVSALGAGRLTEDGIGGSALRVLYNLFPDRMRSAAAGFLEGPVNRIGGVLGNSAVLAALAVGAAPAIAAASLPLCALWLVVALSLWRAYPGLLLQASADRSLVGAGIDKEQLLDRRTVRQLAKGLVDADPRMCRAAIDLVVDAEPGIAAEVLAGALEQAPSATRPLLVDALHRVVEPLPSSAAESPRAAAALERMLVDRQAFPPEQRADLLQAHGRLTAGSDDAASDAVLQRALGDPEAAVRLAAIAELHRRRRPPPGVGDLDAVLRESLEHGDVLMRRSARRELRAMLLSTEPDATWEGRLGLLAERLEQRADRAHVAEALVQVARRHDGAVLPWAGRVLRWSDDRDPRVRAAALRFAGYAGAVAYTRRLIDGLGARRDDVSSAARDGLVALGAAAAAPLLEEYELATPSKREAALSVLRELELESAALASLFEQQLDGARKALLLRGALPAEGTHSLVVRRLQERVVEGLGTSLVCVSVLEGDKRIAELERRLRRVTDERSRDILLEALEALLPAGARAELVPLLEGGDWRERARRAAVQLGRAVPGEREAWSELLADHDPLTRRLAASFAPQAVEERAQIGDAWNVLDPMDVAAKLQDVPAFDRLSTQQLVSLAEVLESLRVEAGEAVYAQGDEGDGIYFVLEGEVEIFHGGVVVSRAGPGHFFGELSTLDGVPRSDAARAVGACRLLRLEREELLALMEQAPALGIGLSQYLALRVRALQERADVQ